METRCLFARRVSSFQITPLLVMKECWAPLWEGRLRNGPMRGPTELLPPTTACCLKSGSLTVNDSCKYLVTSHVISPPSCCSPPTRAYGNPAPVQMLAENAVCQMGANPEPKKGFVLGLSLGSEFKTSSKAICSSWHTNKSLQPDVEDPFQQDVWWNGSQPEARWDSRDLCVSSPTPPRTPLWWEHRLLEVGNH